MPTRRIRLLTAGLLALGPALLAGGCAGAAEYEGRPLGRTVAGASAAAASPSPTPATPEFVAALQRLQGATARYVVDGTVPENGRISATVAFDPGKQTYDGTVHIIGTKYPSAVKRIVVGTDSYQRRPDDSTWVHLDLKRVKPGSLAWFDMADPTGLKKFTTAVTSAGRTGDGTWKGTFNASASLSEGFIPVGAPALWSIGGAGALFTATVDGGGWVTSITVELPSRDGPKVNITTAISGHATALQITAPPRSRVREADPMYYR